VKTLDIAILAVLAYQATVGFRRGLIRIVFDLLAMGIGVAVGIEKYGRVMIWLQQFQIVPPRFLGVVSFSLIWITICAVVMAIGWLANQLFEASVFSIFNRLGGFLLGISKGILLVTPVLMLLVFFHVKAIDSSVLAGPVKPLLQKGVSELIRTPYMNTFLTRSSSNSASMAILGSLSEN